MKRTLLLLTLATGLCSAAADQTVYYSTELTSTTVDRSNGCYGFTLKMSDNFLTSTSAGSSVTLPNTVYMTSLTLWGRDSGNNGEYHNMKIALYEYTGDGETARETDLGTVVALSDAHTLSTGGSATFTFANDVEMDTTKQYRFLFVSADATAENLVGTDGTTNLAAYQTKATTSSLTLVNNNSLPQGDGTYKNNSMSSWESLYMPKLKITSYVPEPATATLSLLALVGLAARRRRK